MPRSDRTALAALTALLLAPGLAHALCTPLAASGHKETLAADVRLDETNTLLGLDGSRIETWQPPAGVETGARAVPYIWAERVDWSVYAAEPGARIATTLLRYARGADGARHLCGIALYSPRTVEEALASPAASLPAPDQEIRYYYDETSRLSGYEQRWRAWDGSRSQSERHCLRYDEHGWLAELGKGSCNGAPRPQARYVHDAAGRLLRTLLYPEGRDQPQEVVVYDEQGRPARRYLRQDGALPYRAMETANPALIVPGPDWTPPALDSYGYAWSIVQTRDADDASLYAAASDPAAVLASGTSGGDGRFTLSSAQGRRIWDAIRQSPGLVHWLWAPGQIYALLPAMPQRAWAACADPRNPDPGAC